MLITKNAFLHASTAQKMKFSIKDLFNKCDQIRCFLQILSHLLKKSLMENFIFCAVLYKSPSQSHEELESFCSSLDSLLSNINDQHLACSIVIEDFNAKCSKWYTSDKDNTAGFELDSITTTAGYSQMINKPTHFINESSSCIPLPPPYDKDI